MRIGYFLNTYPVTSGTFIRREIEALERRGLVIKRFAARRWEQPYVDPRDKAEAERTEYLLSDHGKLGLLKALIKEGFTNIGGIKRAWSAWRAVQKSVGGLARPVAYFAEAALLRQRCAQEGIEHIHSHFGTNATAVAMLCRLLGGPSYSFTAHGPDEFADAPHMNFDLKVGHAAFAVAISHFARMQLIRWGGTEHRDKLLIGRCGLDLREFEPSPVPSESQTFVCVGRLCPQKGQALIPEAIAPLTDQFPELKVVLIGDGDSRAEIEAEIVKHGVEEHIVLAGWMANKEVLETVRQSRALLLPSFAEGLPIVIMEALALGRPAISTFIAGIPELLDGDCGWIFPASSVEGLRFSLRDALGRSQQELDALGQEGRRRIEDRHDIDGLAMLLHRAFAEATGHAMPGEQTDEAHTEGDDDDDIVIKPLRRYTPETNEAADDSGDVPQTDVPSAPAAE
ncbi:MAG: glycosyltransferase family 4 protein [Pseudomonadota bacterium]